MHIQMLIDTTKSEEIQIWGSEAYTIRGAFFLKRTQNYKHQI